MRGELKRKLIHIVIGFAFALAPFPPFSVEKDLLTTAVSILAALLLLYELLSHYLPFEWWLIRPGGFLFIIGIGLCVYLFLPQFALAYLFGVLTLTLADSAAALVGTYWGRTPYLIFRSTKTVEGSLAFFATTFALLFWLLPERDLLRIFAVAVLLTHVELFSVRGVDNLTVPLTGSVLYVVLTS